MRAAVKKAIAFLLAATLGAAAHAAELKVIAAGATRPALTVIIAGYEKSTGNKVQVTFASAGSIRAMLAKGEVADVLILPKENFAEAENEGWVIPGSRADLASVGIGMAVKAGAPVPDISTAEKFKAVLLEAPTIALMDPARGTSGKHLAEVFTSVGIAEQLKPKSQLQQEGYVAARVANGEAAIGLHQMSELLPVPGVTIVGPVPAPYQKTTTYSAGVSARSYQVPAAKSFVAFATSGEAKAVFRSKGFSD
jgi:molybdate transport system substrate-binding protein